MTFMALAYSADAQRMIKGRVTDKNGDPVIGANVVAKGTTVGTITDVDGNYSLSVPEGVSTLIMSYTGYNAQEINLGASNMVDVAMEEGVLLQETVVTALGIKKEEKALVYAVENVKTQDLVESRETNLVQALAAKAAGVQITGSAGTAGASSFITIRGLSTLDGNNQPLFVVDGMPVDNSQNRSGGGDASVASVAYSNRMIDIAPENIESMTVLKGAAATALYGSQAGNGAIIITTKRAKEKTNKVNVDFSSSLGFTQVSQLPELQSTFAQGFNKAYNGPSTRRSASYGPAIDTLRYNASAPNNWDKNGTIVGKSNPAGGAAVQAHNPYDFFRTGVTLSNSIGVSTGGDNFGIRFSFGHLTESGIVPNNTFKRINFGINADTKFWDKFNLGITAKYIRSGGTRIEQGSNVSGVMLGLLRTTPTFDNTNGLDDAANNPAAYTFSNGTPRGYRGLNGAGSSTYDNPYWTVNNNPLEDRVDRIIGSFNLNYDINKWLALTWKPGVDYYTDNRFQYFSIYSAAAPAGRIILDNYLNTILNNDVFLTAKTKLTDKIGATLLVGHNLRQNTTDRTKITGDGLVVPGFNDISNVNSSVPFQGNLHERIRGVYTTLDLDFNNWLYLNGTFRNDKVSTLPIQNNSFNYYSAGVAIDVLGALNYQSDVFNFAKIRASYGKVGLGSAIFYATTNTYTKGSFADGWTDGISFPYRGIPSFTQSDVLANPDLRPEFQTTTEFGTNLKFLKNRIDLDFTYYDKLSDDIIISAPIANSTGAARRIINAGSISNKGIELSLDLVPVKSKNFAWSIGGTYTKNTNEVLALAPDVDAVFLGGFEGSSVRAVKGIPFGSIFGFGFYHDANGAVVIGADGFPVADPNERAFKSSLPDFTVGIRNSLSWKGFSVSALLDIKKGGYMWNGTRSALYFFGTHQETADLRYKNKVFEGNVAETDANGELVLYDHDNNKATPNIPKTKGANTKSVLIDESWLANGNANGFFGNNTEDFIEKTDWVRLRDLTFGYKFAPDCLKKMKMQYLGLSLSGRNVFLKTPYKGVDPETNLYGSNRAQGLDYFNMPGTKSWTVALNVGF